MVLFACHLQVQFKFVLFIKSMFTLLQLAPLGYNYAKRNSVSVSSFEAFSRIPGLLYICLTITFYCSILLFIYLVIYMSNHNFLLIYPSIHLSNSNYLSNYCYPSICPSYICHIINMYYLSSVQLSGAASPEEEAERQLVETRKLLARCYLKLGSWQESLEGLQASNTSNPML